MALQGGKCTIEKAADGASVPLVILGNGPSLKPVLDEHMPELAHCRTMAVNFAANTPEFLLLKPEYYVLADPLFFADPPSGDNFRQLLQNLRAVSWPMTLMVPAKAKNVDTIFGGTMLKIKRFNMIAAEGFPSFERWAYRSGRAMARPRNVLVPAIMTGMMMGYREIFLLGADHGWTKTLDVDAQNRVCSVQPHFYADSRGELLRQKADYLHRPLHQILNSLCKAFGAYHAIERYARAEGFKIYNSTEGSMIDAFERKKLFE